MHIHQSWGLGQRHNKKFLTLTIPLYQAGLQSNSVLSRDASFVIRAFLRYHKMANYSSMKQLGLRNHSHFGKIALLGGTQQTHLMSLSASILSAHRSSTPAAPPLLPWQQPSMAQLVRPVPGPGCAASVGCCTALVCCVPGCQGSIAIWLVKFRRNLAFWPFRRN